MDQQTPSPVAPTEPALPPLPPLPGTAPAQSPTSPVGAPSEPQPAPAEPQSNAKQQVVEAIKGAKNVLVTLGTSPSVDELAASLGLTFLLTKLDKHATAVFSGEVPSAMEFLDPEATFESNVDSLRDFIIALDKEKADKLRYKVEDDVVKIFITPYKTTLTKDDFEFSQGDFNVDVVVALGVQKRDDLDKAITAHGRILHDATVVTVNTNATSGLGSIDWTDPSASSISEMLMSATESFGSGLLDEQISTAFLTGIVAATNRFSNEKTSPKVMTMSAQLMAAGANQQLIATNLRREGMITESVRGEGEKPHNDDGELTLEHEDKKPGDKEGKKSGKTKKNRRNNAANQQRGADDVAASAKPDTSKVETEQEVRIESAEEELEAALEAAAAPAEPAPVAEAAPTESTSAEPSPVAQEQPAAEALPLPDLQQVMASASSNDEAGVVVPAPSAMPPMQSDHKVIQPLDHTAEDAMPAISQSTDRDEAAKPMFGGTLNATTAGAEAERAEQAARESAENNMALSHDITPPSEAVVTPTEAQTSTEDAVEAARKAVEDAAGSEPFNPANQPLESVGAQPLGGEDSLHSVAPDVMNRQLTGTAAPAEQSEPDPMQSFMTTHEAGTGNDAPLVTNEPLSAPAPAAGGLPELPPLPPLPGAPGDLPPLPPLPGTEPMPAPAPTTTGTDPTAGFQPQVNPAFMQNIPQSQNSWSEAGDQMAAKQAEKDAARQEKIDQMGADYDAAVDKNLELQGKPPINNDHSTFPLPPSK